MAQPIKFGTDGWRGIIADDFTFDRVKLVAPIAAQVLENVYGAPGKKRLVIVGHDRRFLAENFAKAAAEAIQKAGFDVLLTNTFAPTPAFSLAAYQEEALGAIVLTASHNPGAYLGLKVKGGFGGSVSPEVTHQIEALLDQPLPLADYPGTLRIFNPWTKYVQTLQKMVNLPRIQEAVKQGKLAIFSNVMHGAAAGGLEQILGVEIHEVNGERDPLFAGTAPEPLEKYQGNFLELIKNYPIPGDGWKIGVVFDGDSDRIAAVDQQGRFLTSQILIPILTEHLITHRGFTGEVIKTISGSDLMEKVARLYHRSVFETAVGYKYIADRMLTTEVLIGGEESGGIGYGVHIPERDALLSALYLLETVVESRSDLSEIYQQLQRKTGFKSEYDRIDLHLDSMEERSRLVNQLNASPLLEIAGLKVNDCNTVDGYKFRLEDGSWLLIRFSGTEPVLRLYCEASSLEQVQGILQWANNWAKGN